MDGLYDYENYRREKRLLEEKLASLVVPGVGATQEAGQLLENLPQLWEGANLEERRKLPLTMLDTVYVDAAGEKSVVAIKPKPAFLPLLEMPATKAGSGVALITNHPLDLSPEDGTNPCFWWRRGGAEVHATEIILELLRDRRALAVRLGGAGQRVT